MSRSAAAGNSAPASDVGQYQRQRPEQSLLYRIVEQHYPDFLAHLEAQGKALPAYVRREFEDYLKCGRLEHGFLRVRCESCHAEKLVPFSCKRRGFCPSCGARRMAEAAALLVDEVFPEQPIRQWVLSFPYPLRFLFAARPAIMSQVLRIVYRVIATHLAKKAGVAKKESATGAVTLIQRFGSALNLNIHFHMLFLDGVYVDNADGQPRFLPVKAPSNQERTQLAQTIAKRVGRFLERKGLLEADAENSYLAEDAVDDDPMNPLLAPSITYRIAVGPHAGRKVFTLQTLPASDDAFGAEAGRVGGFSLHAGVAAASHERDKLERVCRYISRPAVSEQRLSLTSNGNIRYRLKTPYKDGTTHVIFEPLDFLARLAALVPKPRVNLTRFHGVFAPNSRHRALVTPGKRGKGKGDKTALTKEPATPAERHASMRWAQRLKRVFHIDVAICAACGGAVKVIAAIEDPVVIKTILDHLDKQGKPQATSILPEPRAPPVDQQHFARTASAARRPAGDITALTPLLSLSAGQSDTKPSQHASHSHSESGTQALVRNSVSPDHKARKRPAHAQIPSQEGHETPDLPGVATGFPVNRSAESDGLTWNRAFMLPILANSGR